MIRRFAAHSIVLCLAILLACAHSAAAHVFSLDDFWRTPIEEAPSTPTATVSDASPRKFLLQYCGSCHDGGRTTFDFDEASLELSQMQANRVTWELAVQKLRDQKMPPRKSTQPSAEERQAILHWLEETVLKSDPGQLRVRRLPQTEYLNVVRDLFGRSIKPAADLPKDEAAWTACQDVPALAPEHLDHYRSATKQILDAVFAEPSLESHANADEDEDMSAAPEEQSGSSRRLFSESAGKTSAASARKVLASIARRAYRGPVGAGELDRLVTIFDQANANGAALLGMREQGRVAFEKNFSAALEEVMISPRFLYRVDGRDEDPQVPTSLPCSEFDLAARLSFFLWSSGPDDELLDHAQAGTLWQNVETQVTRMLRDPRSKALAKGFANHWLGLDNLDAAKLDDNSPSFPLAKGGTEGALRQEMRKETHMFVAAIVREDRSILEFLDTDFTFLNEPLAKHYGIAGVHGDRFRRVTLHGTGRGGVTTQASVLTLTTKNALTSPVIRGKWVVENLLGESISNPPAEVTKNGASRISISPSSEGRSPLGTNATCAQCHGKMDPIGYTLENFDPLGRRRSKHADTGVLPDGETLHGPEGLKAYLLKHRKQFVRALSERLLAYALSRKLTDRDRAALEQIPDRVASQGFQFSRVVLEVTQCGPFRAGWRGVDRR